VITSCLPSSSLRGSKRPAFAPLKLMNNTDKALQGCSGSEGYSKKGKTGFVRAYIPWNADHGQTDAVASYASATQLCAREHVLPAAASAFARAAHCEAYPYRFGPEFRFQSFVAGALVLQPFFGWILIHIFCFVVQFSLCTPRTPHWNPVQSD
jgi:hypothetical protein